MSKHFCKRYILIIHQRVEEIKKFSAWLDNQPNDQVSFTNIDTNSAVWKIYDTAFTLFFDKKIMDSLFQTNQQVLTIPAKYQMQKIFLSAYDNLIAVVPTDSIKFKKIPQRGGSQTDQYGQRNTIIFYFLIDGKKYDQFAFFFAENSTKLTGITEMAGDENKYKIVRSYIDQLSAIKKKKNF